MSRHRFEILWVEDVLADLGLEENEQRTVGEGGEEVGEDYVVLEEAEAVDEDDGAGAGEWIPGVWDA